MPPRPSLTPLATLTRSYASSSSQVQLPPPPASQTPKSPNVTAVPTSPNTSQPIPKPRSRVIRGSTSRPKPERKQFLYQWYNHLFDTSQLLLLFEYDNCSVKTLQAVRTAISKVPVPKSTPKPLPPSTSSSSSSAADQDNTVNSKGKGRGNIKVGKVKPIMERYQKAEFSVIRTGILGAVARERLHRLQSNTSQNAESDEIWGRLNNWAEGQRAIISSPTLSPSYMAKVLKAIAKTIKAEQKTEKGENVKQPMINLILGVLEGKRLMPIKEIEDVGKLADVQTLRSQVVGMLESQGMGLVGVLSQAGGAGLVRTLQGLEKDLEGKQGEAAAAP